MSTLIWTPGAAGDQTVTITATGQRGVATTETLTVPVAAVAPSALVENQTIEFGALTPGVTGAFGGAKAISVSGLTEYDFVSLDSTVTGTGTGWEISGGRLQRNGSTPASSAGAVLRCTVSTPSGSTQIDVTIAATADTRVYSPVDDMGSLAFWTEVWRGQEAGSHGVVGDLAKVQLRPGDYPLSTTTYSNGLFNRGGGNDTKPLEIRPAVSGIPSRFTNSRTLGGGANRAGGIKFYGIHFYVAPGAGVEGCFTQAMDEMLWDGCQFYGDEVALADIATEPNAAGTGAPFGWPNGPVLGAGSAVRNCTFRYMNYCMECDGWGDFEVTDNVFDTVYFDVIRVRGRDTSDATTGFTRIISGNTYFGDASIYNEADGTAAPHHDEMQILEGRVTDLVVKNNLFVAAKLRNGAVFGNAQGLMNNGRLVRPVFVENVFVVTGQHGFTFGECLDVIAIRNTAINYDGSAFGWMRFGDAFIAEAEGTITAVDNILGGGVVKGDASATEPPVYFESGNVASGAAVAALAGSVGSFSPANVTASFASFAAASSSVTAGALTEAGVFRAGAEPPARVGTVTTTAETGGFSATATAPANGGSAITSYDLSYRATGSTGAWTVVSPYTLGAVVAAAVDEYDVRLRAVNAIGAGFYSAAGTVTVAAATSKIISVSETAVVLGGADPSGALTGLVADEGDKVYLFFLHTDATNVVSSTIAGIAHDRWTVNPFTTGMYMHVRQWTVPSGGWSAPTVFLDAAASTGTTIFQWAVVEAAGLDHANAAGIGTDGVLTGEALSVSADLTAGGVVIAFAAMLGGGRAASPGIAWVGVDELADSAPETTPTASVASLEGYSTASGVTISATGTYDTDPTEGGLVVIQIPAA